MEKEKIVVGISGASGIPVAIETLKGLRKAEKEIHLIVSKSSELTIAQESSYTLQEIKKMAEKVYDIEEIGALLASGSFKTQGMIVVPCSMKTLAGIHSGYCENLLLRAVDVTLKERRKLILAVRETPFSTIHLRNMYELSQMGAVILPLMLSYYNRPKTLNEASGHIAGKILDQFGIEYQAFKRWEGSK